MDNNIRIILYDHEDQPNTNGIMKACDNCRRRKIRCDGKMSCSSCNRRSITCNFSEKKKRTNTSLAKKSKPGDDAYQQSQHPVEAYQLKQQFTDSTGQLARDQSELVCFMGRTSGFFLLQNSYQFHNGTFQCPDNKLHSGNAKNHHIIHMNMNATMRNEHTSYLITLYYDHHQPILPVFEGQREFVKALEENRYSPIALNALFAVASRFTELRHERNSVELAGSTYFEKAKFLLNNDEFSNIQVIQALILMAVYQNDIVSPSRAWRYAGMAFRMAQHLGLYRSCWTWNIPFSERVERTRVFWCCYVLDRILSATHGMPMTFDDRDVDCPEVYYEAPHINVSNEQLLSAVCKVGPSIITEDFVYVIRLCKVLGGIIRTYYWNPESADPSMSDTYMGIKNNLSSWLICLPHHLRDFSSTAVCQLHMLYRTISILLHRPFTQNKESLFLYPGISCLGDCIDAAEAIYEIIEDLMCQPNRIRTLHSLTTYYMFTAGVMFIYMMNMNGLSLYDSYRFKVSKIAEALMTIQTTWSSTSYPRVMLSELSILDSSQQRSSLVMDEHIINLM